MPVTPDTTSHTLSGTTLAIVNALPATHDEAGYKDLTWVTGVCALKEVPEIGREWDTVEDKTVCSRRTGSKKGMFKWKEPTFKLNIMKGDPAQVIYRTLEGSDAVGSFKMARPDGTIIYFSAQVAQFNLTDGGDGSSIDTASVKLLPHGDILYIDAPTV